MDWKQSRLEIKSLSRQLYKSQAQVCLWASFIAFLLLIAAPMLISGVFSPVMDTSKLMEAYASAADPEYVMELYMATLAGYFTPRHIALLAAIFLVSTLIRGPMAVGAAGFFTDAAGGKPVKTGDVMDWYRKSPLALRAFFLSLLVTVINAVLLAALCAVPILLLLLLASLGAFALLAIGAFAGAYVICVFVFIVLALRVSLSVYVMAALNCSTGRAVAAAMKITRGRTSVELFLFVFSFFWYILLCAVTFGAALIFLMPYMGIALAIFTKRLLYRAGLAPKMDSGGADGAQIVE